MCVLVDIRMLAVIQEVKVDSRDFVTLNMVNGTRIMFKKSAYISPNNFIMHFFVWSQKVANGVVHDEVMLGKITLARLNEVVAAAGGVVSIHEGN